MPVEAVALLAPALLWLQWQAWRWAQAQGPAVPDDLWRCLCLRMGATHLPSLRAGQPWRLGASLLLHNDALHLLGNLAVTALLSRPTDRVRHAELLLCAVLANLFSSLCAPDALVLGASPLAFALLAFRVWEAATHGCLPLRVGLAAAPLLASLSSPVSDRPGHFCAFALGLLCRWVGARGFALAASALGAAGTAAVWLRPAAPEQALAARLNYGCFDRFGAVRA